MTMDANPSPNPDQVAVDDTTDDLRFRLELRPPEGVLKRDNEAGTPRPAPQAAANPSASPSPQPHLNPDPTLTPTPNPAPTPNHTLNPNPTPTANPNPNPNPNQVHEFILEDGSTCRSIGHSGLGGSEALVLPEAGL